MVIKINFRTRGKTPTQLTQDKSSGIGQQNERLKETDMLHVFKMLPKFVSNNFWKYFDELFCFEKLAKVFR